MALPERERGLAKTTPIDWLKFTDPEGWRIRKQIAAAMAPLLAVAKAMRERKKEILRQAR